MIFASFAFTTVAHAEPPALTPPALTPPLAPALAPRTEPAGAAPEASYRATTMTADALCIASMLGSFASEGPGGRDSAATGPLLAAGVIGGAWVSPIIHGLHGHGGRAVASWLIRQGAMGAGMIVGLETASCSPDEWFCGLDRIGPGALGGLVVASLIDAALLHDDDSERPARTTQASGAWAPIVAPRSGGATLGFAASF